MDNQPYGRFQEVIGKMLFKKHPYRWTTIGSLDHLASATLEDFQKFSDTYYVPNNAVLVVAGDIDVAETKKMIDTYFAPIPRGKDIVRNTFKEDPVVPVRETFYDPNIQIPAIFLAYRTPAQTEKDAYVLDMVSSVLSDGKSSRLYKKLVDIKKKALQVFAFSGAQEDYGSYLIGALPLGDNSLDDLITEMDEEIVKLQTTLISERDYQKLQNKFENRFVNSNSSVEGIANSLARNYMLYDDTNLINTEIDIYRSITREDIKAAAIKYFKENERVILEYLPESQKEK